MEYKYKAFISYSHTDVKWAEWLQRRIESYRLPRRLRARTEGATSRLHPIFRDRDELPSAYNLSEEIHAALEQSEHLIVICSPMSARSQWVNQEITTFKRLGRSKCVHCLIVDGDPASPDSDRDCFPPALRTHFDQAGEPTDEITEPIAADVRNEADGRKRALLKILAGLIGVGLDDLRQREAQRRQQRMFAVTATSLLVSLVTIGLAISATFARSEAEQRREQAEDLLGFMVGDLRKALQPIGRLDLLESVGTKAMDYFETVSIETLTDRELLKQAEVMVQLGEIRFDQLRYDEASESFEAAYVRSTKLYRNEPSDALRLFHRSQAEFWLGHVASQKGDLTDARIWLTRYRDSGRKLQTMDPDDQQWLREVAYGHHNLAVVNLELGNLDMAVKDFLSEIEIYNELLTRDPDSDVARDRPDAYSWLGDIAFRRGLVLEALDYHQKSEADLRAIYERDPSNSIALDDLAFAVDRVAELRAISGDLTTAFDNAEDSASMFRSLIETDGSNLTWVKGSIAADITRSQILAASGQLEDAKELADSAVRHLNNLVADGGEDHRMRYLLARAHRIIAWIESTSGELQGALSSARLGQESLYAIKTHTELNDHRLGTLASLLLIEGEAHQGMGNHDKAAHTRRLVTDILRDQASTSSSPYLLEPWSRILLLTGDTDASKQISSALSDSGYHSLLPWK